MAKGKGSGAGRPTIMDENTVNKLEDAFSNGATDLQACFYAGISKQTLYNYQDKFPEFVDRKEALKNHLQLVAKNVLAKSIKGGNELDAKWLLERKEKNTYSTKVESAIDISGELSIKQIMDELDDDTT
jgi:hypothetical protein